MSALVGARLTSVGVTDEAVAGACPHRPLLFCIRPFQGGRNLIEEPIRISGRSHKSRFLGSHSEAHCDDKDKYFLVDGISQTPEELGFEPDSPTPPADGYASWMPWWKGKDRRYFTKRSWCIVPVESHYLFSM